MIAMNTKMKMNNLKMGMKQTENGHEPEHEP